MKNFTQAGSNLTIAAPYAVTSGAIVIAGAIIGVAAGAAASGATVDVVTAGVFELPKVGANAFALGAVVYFDVATNLCTSTGAKAVTSRGEFGARSTSRSASRTVA